MSIPPKSLKFNHSAGKETTQIKTFTNKIDLLPPPDLFGFCARTARARSPVWSPNVDCPEQVGRPRGTLSAKMLVSGRVNNLQSLIRSLDAIHPKRMNKITDTAIMWQQNAHLKSIVTVFKKLLFTLILRYSTKLPMNSQAIKIFGHVTCSRLWLNASPKLKLIKSLGHITS